MENPLLRPPAAKIRSMQEFDVAGVVLRITPVPLFQVFVENASAGNGGGAEEEHGEARFGGGLEIPGYADAVGEEFGEPVDEVVVWVSGAGEGEGGVCDCCVEGAFGGPGGDGGEVGEGVAVEEGF